jgi:RHS repeat-associated protein
MYYDAMGRLVKTEMPDGTFSKVEFDSWKQIVYDANDTVKDSDWYTKRMALTAGDPERTAAEKAAVHYNTPSQLHFDTFGRPVLQIENNGKDAGGFNILYKTKIQLDAESNLRKVIDARELPGNVNKGNTVMEYKYDMLGNLVYQKSMDAGQRWLLHNILGKPLRTWDERDHEFQYEYDILHRPTHSVVIGGDGDILLNNVFERIIYGEDLLLPGRANEVAIQALNIIGKPIQHFDTGGAVLTPKYDFKGQPIFTTRKLFSGYKSVANWINTNWTDPNLLADLETDEFTFTTETDALGRITKQTAPDGSVITPAYNEAGLLDGEKVNHFSPATNTYDGDKEYIINIDYNEKGQRHFIKYGNGVKTTYEYDTQTFRLTHLKSNINTGALQNLFYTYDPVGNITRIEDHANDTSFFNNMQVEPVSEYTYDALYRLVKASGRENTAGTGIATKDNWNDASFMQQVNPNDPLAVRNYSQAYQYDKVGNIMQMQHLAVNNYWTRRYNYENTSNRLINTLVGSQPAYTYPHHPQHGFITEMPHLDAMGWNFKEELVKTIRQSVGPGNGTAETTYYQYDGQGQRIRKITENYAQAGADPTKKDERIYIAGYETYRTYDANTINFERQSLSLLEEGHRFVMVETVKQNARGLFSPPLGEPEGVAGTRLTRYQLHNHLGSAALELDNTAQVISYEEYHPFGTTAYQANNATIKAAAKRYRYTGMERDEETGLEYHSARYYLPWLGRWCSCDPIGIGDGVNVYAYAGDNPVDLSDRAGTQTNESNSKTEKKKVNVNVFPPLVTKIRTMSKDNIFSAPVQNPYVKANILNKTEEKRVNDERMYRSTHETIDDQGHVDRLNSDNPFISSFEHLKEDLKNYKGNSSFMKFSIVFNAGSSMADNFGGSGGETENVAERDVSFHTTLPLKVAETVPVERGKEFEKTQQAKGGINTNDLKNNFLIIDNISTEGKFISIADGGLKYNVQKFQILLNVAGSQAKWNQMFKDLELHAQLTVSEEEFFMNAQILVPEGKAAPLKEAIKKSEWGKDLFEKYGEDIILNKIIEAPR